MEAGRMATGAEELQRDLGRLEGQVSGLVAAFDQFRRESGARFDALDAALVAAKTDSAARDALEERDERWSGVFRQTVSGTVGGVIVLLASLFLHRGP